MLKKRSLFILPFVAILMLPIISCEGDDPSVNAGWLRVKLTDATDVTIKELYLELNGIAVYATDSVGQDGDWVSLDYSRREYNLLTLLNGKKIGLVDQYFPADKKLTKVRLELGNNNRFITFTEKPHPLHLPPELANGIDIEMIEPIEISRNIISSLVIDINAALSVYEREGTYFIHPRGRAFSETYGSSLRGYLSPSELNGILFIGIMQDTDTLFTLPEADGMFLFPGLSAGEWEVYLATHPASLYKDTVFVWNIETPGVVDITPKPLRLPLKASVPE